jgi:hypothetical protein
MGGCLFAAKYTMTMDVYGETKSQSESGQIKRQWVLRASGVPCIARSIKGQGIRVVGSTERYGPNYENVEIVKIQTAFPTTKRDRISNILDARGNLTWQEDGVPLILEVAGALPILDGFGTLLEYDVISNRAEVQTLST